MTDKPRSFPSVPDWDGPTNRFREPVHGPFTLPDDEADPSWHRTRHDDIDTRKAVAVVATGLVCFAVGLLIGAAL